MKKDCHLDLWVDEDLELALRRLAEAEDRKLSAYMRLVLQRHVENCGEQIEHSPAANSGVSLSAVGNREQRIGRIANRVRANLQRQDDPE